MANSDGMFGRRSKIRMHGRVYMAAQEEKNLMKSFKLASEMDGWKSHLGKRM